MSDNDLACQPLYSTSITCVLHLLQDGTTNTECTWRISLRATIEDQHSPTLLAKWTALRCRDFDHIYARKKPRVVLCFRPFPRCIDQGRCIKLQKRDTFVILGYRGTPRATDAECRGFERQVVVHPSHQGLTSIHLPSASPEFAPHHRK